MIKCVVFLCCLFMWQWVHLSMCVNVHLDVYVSLSLYIYIYTRLQGKTTTLIYKNIIISFLFPFIAHNVRMGKESEIRRQMSCTHNARGTYLLSTTFPFFFVSAGNIPGYMISRMPTQFSLSYSLPLTQCTLSRFLLACHPRNFRGIFAEKTDLLFTLGK